MNKKILNLLFFVTVSLPSMMLTDARAAFSLNSCNIIENGFDHEFGLEWPSYNYKLTGDNKVFDDAAVLLSKRKSYYSDIAARIFNQDGNYVFKAFIRVSSSWDELIARMNVRLKAISNGTMELVPMTAEDRGRFNYITAGMTDYLTLQETTAQGKIKTGVVLAQDGFTVRGFSSASRAIEPNKDDLNIQDELSWLGGTGFKGSLNPGYIKNYENSVKFLIQGREYNPDGLSDFIQDPSGQNQDELRNAFIYASNYWDTFSEKLVKEVSLKSEGKATLTPISANQARIKIGGAARYFSLEYTRDGSSFKKLAVLSQIGFFLYDF